MVINDSSSVTTTQTAVTTPVTELELLHEGRQKEVYRGTLSKAIEGAPYAACKVAYGQNAMRNQDTQMRAELYKGKLKYLQGVCVPICYGYFVGENDEGSAGCLVLDYCGENVEYHFHYLGFDFTVQIMSASVELQSAGVSHDHVSERNVLGCKDCLMIIDFDESTE